MLLQAALAQTSPTTKNRVLVDEKIQGRRRRASAIGGRENPDWVGGPQTVIVLGWKAGVGMAHLLQALDDRLPPRDRAG